MSDRAYTKTQAQQKTPIGSLSRSRLLQRTCACGQHTIAGTQCPTCRNSQSTLLRFQRVLGSSPTSTPALENASSVNSSTSRISRFGHDFSQIPIHSSRPPVFQTKLTVNQPGDVYEQEANQVAEQVMCMPNMAFPISDEEDEAKTSLMRKQSSQTGNHAVTDTRSVPPIVHDVLNGGGGQPLDAMTRAFMEPRFGHDFSQVRIHTDTRANESAKAVNALAYTVGRDIIFESGRYRPETTVGRTLLAHELTHSIQQIGSTNQQVSLYRPHHFVQRSPKPQENFLQKYKITPQKGDKDWAESDIEDLKVVLTKLKPQEAKALEGYHFERWSTIESRKQKELGFKSDEDSSFGEECGRTEPDFKNNTYKVAMYDLCFEKGQFTSRGSIDIPRSSWTIMHEIGHVMQHSEERRIWTELQRLDAQANALEVKFATGSQADKKKLEKINKRIDIKQKQLDAAMGRIVTNFGKIVKGKPVLTPYSKHAPQDAFAEAFVIYKLDPNNLKQSDKELYNWFEKFGHLGH